MILSLGLIIAFIVLIYYLTKPVASTETAGTLYVDISEEILMSGNQSIVIDKKYTAITMTANWQMPTGLLLFMYAPQPFTWVGATMTSPNGSFITAPNGIDIDSTPFTSWQFFADNPGPPITQPNPATFVLDISQLSIPIGTEISFFIQ